MIRIFTDFDLVPRGTGPVPMLYPFLTDSQNVSTRIPDQFKTYCTVGRSLFRLCPADDADIAVFPVPWEYIVTDKRNIGIFERFSDTAGEYGIPVVIFFLSDSERPIILKDTIIFRTSLNKSRQRGNEFAYPAWEENILDTCFGGKSQIRKKEQIPTVGFTGYAPRHSLVRDVYNRAESSFGFKGPNKGSFSPVRSEAVKVLSASPLIRTQFILRKVFWGTQRSPARKRKEKEEFIANIIGSDYILCTRGGGNFSYRFYETLSCGRIPLFINTDCVLPYDFRITYKDYCVWVEQEELSHADRILRAFHETLSDEDFVLLQERCRKLWQHYLSPEGFFAHFHEHLA